MSTDNPNPIVREVQVVLAGNLADDDLMWIVRCSPSELQGFLLDPPGWVGSLADLPEWATAGVDGPVPRPVLLPDFSTVVHRKGGSDPDGWVAVQGISETNEVTILATRNAAIGALLAFPKIAAEVQAALDAGTNPFAPLWAEAGTGGRTLLVNVALPIARAYGHYEVSVPGETPTEGAARVVAMLLSSAIDPTGLARMLGTLPQRALYVDGPSRKPGPPIGVLAADSPSVVCANVVGAAATGDNPDPAPLSCMMVEGPHDPSLDEVVVDGIVIKRYTVETT